MSKLNNKQLRFIDEYLIDLNAAQAAIRAGYSVNVAAKTGCVLLKDPKIAAEIERKQKVLSARCEISQEKVVSELACLSFSNMADFAEWDEEHVRLKSSSSLSRSQTACVMEVTETRTANGSNVKIKLFDKAKAIDSLAKILGMLVERKEISGPNGTPLAVVSSNQLDFSNLTADELKTLEHILSKSQPSQDGAGEKKS